MAKRIIFGFIVAVVLGGGAGAAIAPVAKKMAPVKVDDSRPPAIDPGKVVVESVTGEVQFLDKSGEWEAVVPASRVSRPVRLRTVGKDAEVSMAFRGVRLVAGHEADLMLSAPGPEPAVLVSAGHVRLHRGSKPMTLYVPDREIKLIGQTFGVWVREDVVAVAVLDEVLEVHAPGRKPIKFARGRELAITSSRLLPAVLDQQLSIQVQGTSRRGYRYTLTGRTAPHARVVHTNDDKQEKLLSVSPAGTFSVDLLDRRPQAGQLVAFDSAGRRAEVDKPSKTLDEVVAALTGKVAAAEAAPEAPEKAAPAPEKAPQKAAPKKAPPPETAPAPEKVAPKKAAEAKTSPAEPAAKSPRKPRVKAEERGKAPPEPVKLELGGGAKLGSPGLEKPEVELGDKPKATPKAAPKPKPTPKPAEPKSADEEAL